MRETSTKAVRESHCFSFPWLQMPCHSLAKGTEEKLIGEIV
ncbi:uncharacterized protein J3R85_014468 [Psidium guajava]|nr:uncharacterized protein J3R85_014468 [Psidium guajava]